MIIVCGEALIDVVRTTDGSRRATPGGGPFNTARALARLGVPAAFVGRLSEDRSGTELAGLLKADGVSLRWASVGPEPTTIAVADVDSAGVAEYRFQVEGTSAPNLTEEMLPHSLGPGWTRYMSEPWVSCWSRWRPRSLSSCVVSATRGW